MAYGSIGWGEFVRKFCKQSLRGKCPKEFVQKAWLSEISLKWPLLMKPMTLDLGNYHFHMKVAVLIKQQQNVQALVSITCLGRKLHERGPSIPGKQTSLMYLYIIKE